MKKSLLLFLISIGTLLPYCIMAEETVIEDAIRMQDRIFQKDVNYMSKEFDAPVDFSFSTFKKALKFSFSKFHAGSKFIETEFEGKAEFRNVEFLSDTYFKYAAFSSEVNFSDATFSSELDFSNAKFYSTAKFHKTKFNGDVYFNDGEFKSIVEFEDAEFNGDVSFKGVDFDSLANFQNTEFNADVDFTSALLPNYLDFSNVTNISNEINLTRSIIPDTAICYISITGADIDKIKFRFQRFRLWFKEEDSVGYELKSNVYEELLKKQSDEGFTQSYEKLDKEYREFKYTNIEGSQAEVYWGKFQNWIDKNWWGYGYNKELIVLNSILLYLLFSLLNVFFLKHLTIRVYEAEKINEYWDEAKGSKTTKFFNSIPFSLFYTAQIFFGFKFDVEKLKYKENLQGWKIFNLVYFIIIYLSGLVCFAYLANYVVTI